MEEINYKKLYEIQDEVFKIVFASDSEFYLTGGTCLSRFYFEKRYSDDLDFFSHNLVGFGFAVKNIFSALSENFRVSIEVSSKDFIRYKVNDILQIDFINDRVKRFGKLVVTKENFIIDNLENILSNKLTAVIGRDEAKDIFDIFLIRKLHSFSWRDILKMSHEKETFSDDDLIIKLKSFPKSWMDEIKLIDKNFLNDFNEMFAKIIEEITEAATLM